VATTSGAEHDFRAFVVTRQRALLRTAWLLTADWALAEDLVQTALMRTWPKWRRLSGPDAGEAYVRRVMVNAFLNGRRRRWRGEIPVALLPETAAPDATAEADLRHLVATAVQALPPRQRAVVVLRFFDDLTEAQTATVLGIAVVTVKSQTAKAFATLRRHPQLDAMTQGAP
jgi:RNA polymerase sigma-70 factor (sigma-E family)